MFSFMYCTCVEYVSALTVRYLYLFYVGPCNQVFSVFRMVSIFSSNPSFSFHPLMTDLFLIMEFQSLPDPKPKQPFLSPKSGCSRELCCVGNGGGRGLVLPQRCTQTNPTQLWKRCLTISLIIL